MNREEFEAVSQAAEKLLRPDGFFVDSTWLVSLLMFAHPGNFNRFYPVMEQMIAESGNAPDEPVRLRPWKSDPSIEIVCMTAHGCTGLLIGTFWEEVIEVEPLFKNFPEDMAKWADDELEGSLPKIKKLFDQADMAELHRIASLVQRERILTLKSLPEENGNKDSSKLPLSNRGPREDHIQEYVEAVKAKAKKSPTGKLKRGEKGEIAGEIAKKCFPNLANKPAKLKVKADGIMRAGSNHLNGITESPKRKTEG